MKKILAVFLTIPLFALLVGCSSNQGDSVVFFPNEINKIKATYYFNGSESSWELNKNEILLLKDWADTLELRRDTSKKEEPYAGGEGWTFDVNDGESVFSYFWIDNEDKYIDLDNKWYVVSNPSNPPVSVSVEVEPKKELTLEKATIDSVFGNLFPKKIMEGYVIDGSVGIYNDTILVARFYNEALLDEMLIEVAAKEWFYNQNADLKPNTIIYQETTDGTGSYIYVDGGDYIVQYTFSKTDVGNVLDVDKNAGFLNMVNSAEQFGDFLLFERRLYNKNELSQKTLEWLDWYNSLAPETRLATSYIPEELLSFEDVEATEVYGTD